MKHTNQNLVYIFIPISTWLKFRQFSYHRAFGGFVSEVKILKKPKFDITKLMELHGEGGHFGFGSKKRGRLEVQQVWFWAWHDVKTQVLENTHMYICKYIYIQWWLIVYIYVCVLFICVLDVACTLHSCKVHIIYTTAPIIKKNSWKLIMFTCYCCECSNQNMSFFFQVLNIVSTQKERATIAPHWLTPPSLKVPLRWRRGRGDAQTRSRGCHEHLDGGCGGGRWGH